MRIKSIWDAIVIGAGPAGSFAALKLSKQFENVLLIDKAIFPRFKVCGSCLNQEAVNYLAEEGLHSLPSISNGSLVSGITLYRAGSMVNLDLPNGIAVSRAEFDLELAQQAQGAGAVFLDGWQAVVQSIPSDTKLDLASVVIESDNERQEIKCRAVVVADGLNGNALKAFKRFTPIVAEKSRVGLGVILPPSPDEDASYGSNHIHMFLSKCGYLGIVRLGDGSLDVALAADQNSFSGRKSPGEVALDMISVNGLRPPDGLSDARFRGTARLTRQRRSVAEARLFVLGDAISYTEPFTGQGIAWALKSAALASNDIAKAIKAKDFKTLQAAKVNWQRLNDYKLRPSQLMSTVVAKAMTGGDYFNHATFALLLLNPTLKKSVGKFVIEQMSGASTTWPNRSELTRSL